MNLLRPFGVALVVWFVAFTAQAATLKIATLSPEGSSWMQKFRASAKEINERTSNRVKFKYYPGGVMGDDSAVLKKIKIGQLHGGAMTGGSLSRFYPDSQIYSMPLKFNSLEQVDHVRTAIDPVIVDGFEQGGFVTFGISGGGFAYLMSKEPITHPDQMKEHKVWSPSSDAATEASFSAFEISPIPLPIGDVLAGLQTELIDTIATSPVAAINLQWHTQLKYVTEVPIIYVYAVMAIESKAFNKLSKEDRAVVREVMSRVFAEIDQENRGDNEKALDALKNQGIQILTPSNEEMAAWRSKGSLAQSNLLKQGVISQKMANMLQEQLATFDKTAGSH